MAVVRIDIPSQNAPHLRERFIPIQNIYENLISAEEVRVEKVAVHSHLIFGIRIIASIKMILIDIIYPGFKAFNKI